LHEKYLPTGQLFTGCPVVFSSSSKGVDDMESDFGGFTALIEKDIRNLKIDTNQTADERKSDYIRQIGSENTHQCGDIEVKCTFGSMKIENMISDLVMS
jgi:hypothetical protein